MIALDPSAIDLAASGAAAACDDDVVHLPPLHALIR